MDLLYQEGNFEMHLPCVTTCQSWMCDGCGEPTSMDHTLNCRKGGMVIRRLNEVRDALGERCWHYHSEIRL